ncbi:MAG: LTA synthase family protein [Muribaculaceae bacterium]
MGVGKWIEEMWLRATGSRLGSLVCNVVIAFAVMMLARVLFFVTNIGCFVDYLSWQLVADVLRGALLFDASAMVYVNAIYVLLVLLPVHSKESHGFAIFTKCVWIVLNGVALAANLCDCVYFSTTGNRTTAHVLAALVGDADFGSTIAFEALNHWYMVIIFGAMVWAMWRLYRVPTAPRPSNLTAYYAVHSVALLAAAVLGFAGARGSFTLSAPPVTIGNAARFVNRPVETALVLNTPFTIISTIGRDSFDAPSYLTDPDMEAAYSPVHSPVHGKRFGHRNVVVIILNGIGSEYSGILNSDLDGGSYSGFTPFLDSLMTRGTTFRYCFANGSTNADAVPAVLSGIPTMKESFILNRTSLNKLSSIAGELRNKGYHSAFFCGSDAYSLRYRAFARAAGFGAFYGVDEYRLSHPDSIADISLTGAISDEPFLQFCCNGINGMKQPFVATAVLGDNNEVPAKYRQLLPAGKLPVHRCVEYTDMALRRFFDAASQQKWYGNTLFVITSDRTGPSCRSVYQSDLGAFAVPIVLYAPADTTLRRGVDDRPIVQHTDVMPTVMGYLGYDRTFIAFGSDLLHTRHNHTFAVNYHNGVYQYVKGEYLLQFDGTRTTGLFRFKSDRLLQVNLVNRSRRWQPMELELKAIIQQYMQRIDNDNLTITTHSSL